MRINILSNSKQYTKLIKEYIYLDEDVNEVITTSSIEKVNKNIKKGWIDILLIDTINEEFALRALEKIKKNKSLLGNVYIIVISTITDNEIIQQLLNLGVSKYILKPYEISSIIESMEEYKFIIAKRAELETEKTSEKTVNNTKNNYDIYITDIIQQIGIPAHIKGYKYLRAAIGYAISNREYVENITKSLYPTIAEEFASTGVRVERAIRHAIELAWSRGPVEMHNKVFGYTVNSNKGKPTNAEFIARIADKIIMETNLRF